MRFPVLPHKTLLTLLAMTLWALAPCRALAQAGTGTPPAPSAAQPQAPDTASSPADAPVDEEAPTAEQQGERVIEIRVEGNRRVEADTIRSYFRPAPGERLDSYKIDQALKALYATGLFQDVRINQSGGRLIVTVVENPVINRVAFEGNKKIKDEQLGTEVQSKARGTFSRAMVQS
ncbi:MAG TPA: POTRA domain-containing protein, partial [Hyalangium sp.]|nr:POTRA domain-containing protein [Hyalangium sp.]